MPTKTFLNLNKDKKIRILKAAKKEFSRVPLEKAVIANIVSDAKIPRGSFYQYFENIEDLFVYLINYLYGVDKKKFQRYLELSDNDIFEALKIRFASIVQKMSIAENRQFRVNVISSLMNKNSKIYEIPQNVKLANDLPLEYFPKEMCENQENINYLNIISMINSSYMEKLLLTNDDKDKVTNEYNNYMDFVKMKLTNK